MRVNPSTVIVLISLTKLAMFCNVHGDQTIVHGDLQHWSNAKFYTTCSSIVCASCLHYSYRLLGCLDFRCFKCFGTAFRFP